MRAMLRRVIAAVVLPSLLSLAACSKGKKADGPPCERLAVALCESGDKAPCAAFIAKRNEGKAQADADKWCASIVDDPSAVKVFKEDAQKGAAGAATP